MKLITYVCQNCRKSEEFSGDEKAPNWLERTGSFVHKEDGNLFKWDNRSLYFCGSKCKDLYDTRTEIANQHARQAWCMAMEKHEELEFEGLNNWEMSYWTLISNEKRHRDHLDSYRNEIENLKNKATKLTRYMLFAVFGWPLSLVGVMGMGVYAYCCL